MLFSKNRFFLNDYGIPGLSFQHYITPVPKTSLFTLFCLIILVFLSTSLTILEISGPKTWTWTKEGTVCLHYNHFRLLVNILGFWIHTYNSIHSKNGPKASSPLSVNLTSTFDPMVEQTVSHCVTCRGKPHLFRLASKFPCRFLPILFSIPLGGSHVLR